MPTTVVTGTMPNPRNNFSNMSHEQRDESMEELIRWILLRQAKED